MSCCPPRGYTRVFSKRAARRDAKRYRRDGLDDTADEMVDFLRERGVEGASVLEIGGGVGAIQLELLKAGAARATNVELSPEYEEVAGELARERGVAEQVERRLGDVVKEPELAGPADAVVMHRVVCCYPDYDALVGAASERARRYLVMSFPRPRRADPDRHRRGERRCPAPPLGVPQLGASAAGAAGSGGAPRAQPGGGVPRPHLAGRRPRAQVTDCYLATAGRLALGLGSRRYDRSMAVTAQAKLDARKLRADFPIFEQSIHGKPLAYLDSANSSQKPRQVLDTLRDFYETSYANVHRAVYELGLRSDAAYDGAREKARAYVNAETTAEIIFTRNATEGLNLVAYAWGLDNLGPGDLVLVTELEHHSNFVPWQYIAQRTGADFAAIPIDENGELRLEDAGRAGGARARQGRRLRPRLELARDRSTRWSSSPPGRTSAGRSWSSTPPRRRRTGR